jgi:putative transposase
LKHIGSLQICDVKKDLCTAIKGLAARRKRGQNIGKLKYKSEITSINIHRFGAYYRPKNGKITLPKVGRVKVSGLEQIVDKGYEIANAKLLNRPDGYYLKVTTYQQKQEQIYKGEEIGIDLGVSTAVTLSDGRKFNASVEESERLKRLQRKFAKQVKGSNNRRKTLRKTKVEYQKLTNKKNDLANKIVHEIKQYKNIYMQDENLTSWKMRFGKKVQHSVLGRVKAKLIDQAYVLDRYVPTTKACYNCGQIHEIPLSQRVFTCDCGIEPEDRDVHAAKNMIVLAKLGQKLKTVPMGHRDLGSNVKKSVELRTSSGVATKLSSERRSRKTLTS